MITNMSSPEQVQEFALTAKAVANQFLDWAEQEGLPISNMKLQKMVYFAHADFLQSTDKPLVREVFEAWDHGPVIPQLYQSFKKNGSGPILDRAMTFDPITATSAVAKAELSDGLRIYLKRSYDFYKKIGTYSLRGLSHSEGGPWWHALNAFEGGRNPDRRIGETMIRPYHRQIGDS